MYVPAKTWHAQIKCQTYTRTNTITQHIHTQTQTDTLLPSGCLSSLVVFSLFLVALAPPLLVLVSACALLPPCPPLQLESFLGLSSDANLRAMQCKVYVL